MYLPLEYVKRYSVLTELYCSEEYINCEPEVLLEMIADADWGTSNYSGPNKERYIHTYNMFDNNYFAMHIISACFATAGFAGVWKYNKIVYEPDYDFQKPLPIFPFFPAHHARHICYLQWHPLPPVYFLIAFKIPAFPILL